METVRMQIPKTDGTRFRKFSFAEVFGFAGLIAVLAVMSARWLFPLGYRAEVNAAAARYGLEPSEVYAVIKAESNFDPRAKSRAGALGLMQLLPSTAEFCAKLCGMDDYEKEYVFDPEKNIMLGCCYLGYLKERFDGRYVYAAYNAGEGRVRLWLDGGGNIPVKETADYVVRVTRYKKIYELLYGL